MGAAVDAVAEWAGAVGGTFTASDQADLELRLDAMPDMAPWIPQAVRDCRSKGVRFKSLPYVMRPVLDRVDELKRQKPGGEPPPLIDPFALLNRCKTHFEFGGRTIEKCRVGANPAGLIVNGQVWVPANRLTEVLVDA